MRYRVFTDPSFLLNSRSSPSSRRLTCPRMATLLRSLFNASAQCHACSFTIWLKLGCIYSKEMWEDCLTLTILTRPCSKKSLALRPAVKHFTALWVSHICGIRRGLIYHAPSSKKTFGIFDLTLSNSATDKDSHYFHEFHRLIKSFYQQLLCHNMLVNPTIFCNWGNVLIIYYAAGHSPTVHLEWGAQVNFTDMHGHLHCTSSKQDLFNYLSNLFYYLSNYLLLIYLFI